MSTLKRMKTNYPGVFFIEGTSPATGKPEKIFYIRDRKAGKMIEEKAGRQFQDDMTAARAAMLRAARVQGKQPSRKEARAQQEAAKKAEAARWTINRLWQKYSAQKHDSKGLKVNRGRYDNYLKASLGHKEPRNIAHLDVDRLRISIAKASQCLGLSATSTRGHTGNAQRSWLR